MNVSLKHGVFPKNASDGIQILLTKIRHWNGELNKTRPITLLDSHRKIFEAIVAKRMTKIIEENEMLRGTNFGFRAGMGTKEAIFMIRTLFDTNNSNKQNLYLASLDVQAAFDTVPWTAIENGLKRIKAPQDLICCIKYVLLVRSLGF